MVMVSHPAQPSTFRDEAPSPPFIEAQNLSKHFGGLRAVSAVSFAIRRGEMVGVIGPNGSGKTTLFGLLSGFLPPTTGEIRFQGQSIVGLGPDRLCHLGIVRTFQMVRPFPDMSVFENVKAAAIFGKPEKRSEDHIQREVNQIPHASNQRKTCR